MPSAAASFLVNSLSMAAAEANTFAPTYGMPAISSMPWMVPSSPYAPCRAGKTTSTSASTLAPAAGSSTISPLAVGSAGSTTAAPAAAVISGSARSVMDSRGRVAVGQDPAALAGDADRHHLELVGVERGEDAARADARDGVLGAATAEHDRDAGLARGRHWLGLSSAAERALRPAVCSLGSLLTHTASPACAGDAAPRQLVTGRDPTLRVPRSVTRAGAGTRREDRESMRPALHVIAWPGPGGWPPWPIPRGGALAGRRDDRSGPGRGGRPRLGADLGRAQRLGLAAGGGAAAAAAGIEFLSFPIADRGVPGRRGRRRDVVALGVRLAAHVRAGRFVVTQCFAGIGRSTLLACATLVMLGVGPEDGAAAGRRGPRPAGAGHRGPAPTGCTEFAADPRRLSRPPHARAARTRSGPHGRVSPPTAGSRRCASAGAAPARRARLAARTMRIDGRYGRGLSSCPSKPIIQSTRTVGRTAGRVSRAPRQPPKR